LTLWLYDAARLPDTNEPRPDDVAALVPSLVHFYSMRHILKRLFDKVLHLGHYLDDDGVWVPHDRALATPHQAWFARAQAVFGAAPAKLMGMRSGLSRAERRRCGLSRSITEFRRGRHGARFKVETLGYLSNRAPQQPLIRAGARASYLSDFLESALPLMPDLTPAMIETRGGYAKTQRARSLPLFCARRTASASAPTTLMRSRVAIWSMRSARRLPSIARLPISSSPFLPTALRPVESEGQAHKPLAERPVQVEYFCHLFWTSAPIAFHSSECPSLFPECSDHWIASIIFTR